MLVAPYLAIDLIGVLVAASYWRRYPRVALLTGLAFGALGGLSVLWAFLYVWLPGYVRREWGLTNHQIVTLFDALTVGRTLLGAVAMGVLLLAVFGDRSGTGAARPVRPPHGPDAWSAEGARSASGA